MDWAPFSFEICNLYFLQPCTMPVKPTEYLLLALLGAAFESKCAFLGCRWEQVICAGHRAAVCSNKPQPIFHLIHDTKQMKRILIPVKLNTFG